MAWTLLMVCLLSGREDALWDSCIQCMFPMSVLFAECAGACLSWYAGARSHLAPFPCCFRVQLSGMQEKMDNLYKVVVAATVGQTAINVGLAFANGIKASAMS